MNIQTSEKTENLYAALASAQGEMEGAKKDSTNPHFRSKYADLASIREASREALAKNGLALLQFPGQDEKGNNCLLTRIVHKSGEWLQGPPLIFKLQKDDIQGLGSGITYSRRYAEAAALGIAPEDDDGEGAVNREGGYRDERPQQREPERRPEPRREAPNANPPPVALKGWRGVVWHGKSGKVTTQGAHVDEPYFEHTLAWIHKNDPEGFAYWVKQYADSEPDPKANPKDVALVKALAEARAELGLAEEKAEAKAKQQAEMAGDGDPKRAEYLDKISAILTSLGKTEIWLIALLQQHGQVGPEYTSLSGIPTPILLRAVRAEQFIRDEAKKESK